MRTGSASPLSQSPTKTKPLKSPNPCWRFMQGTYCPEELCHYQHGPPLGHNHDHSSSRHTHARPANYGPSACIFFARGFCKNGDSCQFAHVVLPHPALAPIIIPPALPPHILLSPMTPSYDSSIPVALSQPELQTDEIVQDSAESAREDAAVEQLEDYDEDDIVQPHPFDDYPELTASEQTAPTRQSDTDSGTTSDHTKPFPNSDNNNPDVPLSSEEIQVDESDSPFYEMDEEVAAIWAEVENSGEDQLVQYVDKNRYRQVYDDKKVLVLSGGVMLGPPTPRSATGSSTSSSSFSSSGGESSSYSWTPSSSTFSASAPASSALPSSSSSSGFDFLRSPVEWNSSSTRTHFDWSEEENSTFSPKGYTPDDQFVPPLPPVGHASASSRQLPQRTNNNSSSRSPRRQDRRQENRARREAAARDNALRSLEANRSSYNKGSPRRSQTPPQFTSSPSSPVPMTSSMEAELSEFLASPSSSRSPSPSPVAFSRARSSSPSPSSSSLTPTDADPEPGKSRSISRRRSSFGEIDSRAMKISSRRRESRAHTHHRVPSI